MGSTPTPTPTATGQQNPAQPSLAQELETPLVGSRVIHFKTRDVQPPAALYVTGDDGLYINLSNVQNGVSVTVTATLLLPDGRVQASAWSFAPPSTGAQTSYLVPLSEAFLLNVSVTPNVTVRYGYTWVFMAVRRGGMASGINLQTLIAAYISGYSGPTWPGAQITGSIDGPGLVSTYAPGTITAGQPFSFTVPNYARILMRTVFCQLQTSATVATRQIYLAATDGGGNEMYADMVEPTQAASLSVVYCWGLKVGWAQTSVQAGYITRSLPEFYLMPGATLKVAVNNMQAADVFNFCTMGAEQWFSA